MQSGESNGWLAWGSVLAALGASLCCILPLAVALLGVGSAALGAQLEPLRPYMAALTSGMTCSGCEAGVRVALKRLDGVRQVDASYLEGRVAVTYDPAQVEPLRIKEAIESLGYQAELRAEPSRQEKEGSL